MRYITGLCSIPRVLGMSLNAFKKQLKFLEAGSDENHYVCTVLWDDARTDGGTPHVRASI